MKLANITLYPFQEEGVQWLIKKNGRGLIADEMGLGKTIQALAWLALNPDKRPSVIVCPASLKFNWEAEARRILPTERVHILEGRRASGVPSANLYIINYDILPYWVEALKLRRPYVLILDEVHYIKNAKTKRTKAVKKLAKGVPHLIALSGTPIVNRPAEFYTILKLIDPNCVPSFWFYAKRYCGLYHNGFGWKYDKATNTEELHRRLNGRVMIRRTKEEVLTELPSKVRTILPVAIENRREYDLADHDFMQWLQEKGEKKKVVETLAKIEVLKQLSVKGKLNTVIQWIKDFLETDQKLVVFATHKFVVKSLVSEFRGTAVHIDGSTPQKERALAIRLFQKDPRVRLFVGNIQAAGVGLTLTAASNVAFVELPWTPAELEQAEDRCHRIGQKDTVNVYYLLGRDTIEEKIAWILEKKKKVLSSILDGKSQANIMLDELIKLYKE